MNIAFVMGFFDRVKIALDECYPDQAYRDRLIWIPHGQRMLAAFKGRFYELVKSADGVLICLGRSKRDIHLEHAVAGMVSVAQEQSPCKIRVQVFGNLYDPRCVLELVKSFGIETQPQINSDVVRLRVPDGKILCMSLDGKTSIFTSLVRAGFSPATISECFHEEIRIGGRNSNLMEELR